MVTEVRDRSRVTVQRSRSTVERSKSACQRSRSASAYTRHNKNGDLNLRDNQEILPDKPRHLSPPNCCQYCDRYHIGVMTHHKHSDINAWRMDVNKNMANDNRIFISDRKKEDNNKKYKLVYLKYNVPGTPDTDPGFRKISTKERRPWTRKDANNWQGDFDLDGLSTDLGSISLDVGDRVQGDHDLLSARNKQSKRRTKSCRSAKSAASDKSTATCLSNGTDFSRSNSNRLLNVLTIDDYKYRYGSTYSKVTDDSSIRPSPNQKVTAATPYATFECNESPRAKSRQSHLGSAIQSGYNIDSDVTFDLNSNLGSQMNVENETVERAYQVVMGSKKPVNNDAHRLLYPQPKVAPNHTSKRSKKFNKLHKALHKWMDEEILRPHSMRMTSTMSPQPLSTYSQMMDSPNWMNGAPDPGYSSAQRPSRKSRCSRMTGNTDSGVISEEPIVSPHKRDNNAFLEMLMEMENSQVNDSSLDTSFAKTDKYQDD